AGQNGVILKTTDGGVNWNVLNAGTGEDLNNIYFLNESVGFVCGNNGIILLTEDGGRNWYLQNSQTTNNLESIIFSDDTTGWISGQNGTILKCKYHRTKELLIHNLEYDFGTIEIGKTIGTSIILENIGYPELKVDSVKLESEVFEILAPQFPCEISPYSAIELKIRFEPNIEFNWKDTLYFFYEGNSKYIVLYGNGVIKDYPPIFYPQLNYGLFSGEKLLFTLSGNDPEGEQVNFNVDLKKINGGFNQYTDEFLWTPGENDSGIYNIQVTAYDNAGNEVEKNINIMVTKKGNWVKILQADYPVDINEIEFIDNSTCIGVCDNGKIIKTSDKGINWYIVETGYGNNLNDISFIDENTGWIAGEGGVILKSVDSGETWTLQFSSSSAIFKSVYGIDSLNCWVVGEGGKVYNTTDGGNSWFSVNLGTLSLLYEVFFQDSLTGWICGENGRVYKTTDGGNSWVRKYVQVSDDLLSICFIDSSFGWIAGTNGMIIKTTDGGESWSQLNTNSNLDFNCVYFIDRLTGFVCSESNALLKTTDGGDNWYEFQLDSKGKLFSIKFNDNLQGWIAGEKGLIISTNDIGNSWFSQFNLRAYKFNDIFFVDGSKGWIVSDYGKVFYTGDKGLTWEEQDSGIEENLNSVYFLDEYRGYIIGNSGTLLKTTDGGKSWDYSKIANSNLYDIKFISSDTGWICGSTGIVLRTYDGGETWTQILTGINNTLYSIDFYNSSTGWAAGDEGSIIYTSDKGDNWLVQYSNVFDRLNSIFILNDNCIFAAGNNGTILKWSNGSWVRVDYSGNENLNDIIFLDDLRGIIAGDSGRIVITTDGGNSWQIDSLAEDIEFLSINNYGTSSLWLCGNYATVFRFDSTAYNNTIDISLTDTTASSGDSIPIFVDIITDLSSLNVTSFQAGISWDTTLIKLKSISYENSILNSISYYENSNIINDRVLISISSSTAFPSSGRLLVLNFVVKDDISQVDTTYIHFFNLEFNVQDYTSRIVSGGKIILNPGYYNLGGRIVYYSDTTTGIDNVTIFAMNGNMDSTISAGGGNYTFSGISGGNLQVYPFKSGDIPELGVITPYDASLVLRESILLDTLTPYQLLAGNVDGSVPGEFKLDPYDASLILKRSVLLIDEFPGGKYWIFIPDTFDISRDNFHHYPDTINCGYLNSDISDLNFKGIVVGDVDGNWAQKQGLLKGEKRSSIFAGKIKRINNRIVIPFILDTEDRVYSFGIYLKVKEKVEKVLTSSDIIRAGFLFEYNIKENGIYLGSAGKNYIKGKIHLFDLIFRNNQLPEVSIKKCTINGKIISIENNIAGIPDRYYLNQNYPNPFNSETTISFCIPEITRVSVKIYNLLGQVVKTLIDSDIFPGYYTVKWNGKNDYDEDVASGIYFITIKTPNFIDTKKMVFIK
ncbi:hypothetical protein DRQ09_05195, partial [candidate division KSB1 bacterium]